MSVITHTSVTYPILNLCTSNKFTNQQHHSSFCRKLLKCAQNKNIKNAMKQRTAKLIIFTLNFSTKAKQKKVICSPNDTCTENNRGALFAGFGAVRLNIC